MFWIILLCHFIADYPLQTGGMVAAKKTPLGLITHVYIHWIVMLVVLYGVLDFPVITGMTLALAVSLFHLVIDFWKNVLCNLKPDWVIINYLQDQILHLLSILLVSFIWQQLSDEYMFARRDTSIIFAIGFLLIGHVWFITESILSHQNLEYQHWVKAKIWQRILFRSILYCSLIFGFNLIGFLVFTTAFLVSWFDFESEQRRQQLLIDSSGVVVIMILTQLVLIG